MHPSLAKLAVSVLATATLITAVGCGSSGNETVTTKPPGATGTSSPAATSTTTSPATTTSTATLPKTTTSATPGSSTTMSIPPDGDGGIDPMNDASTDPQSAADSGTSTALLEAVRVARNEGFDRVVFQFRDHVPGYLVKYSDKPILSDGAGEPVPLEGTFAITVRMESASGVDLSGTGPTGYEEVYTGPKRINAGTPEISEVVQSGDYEAVLSWAIGTRDRVDFRVFTLTSPPRLVVDVRNH